MQTNPKSLCQSLRHLAVLTGMVTVMFVVAPVVRATLVVDFNNYTTGQLAGQAGGTGLTGNWGGSLLNSVVAGDLLNSP